MPYSTIFNVPHFYALTAKAAPSRPPLVFVHGWLLSHQYWQPIIQQLDDDFQCLSYDLRGFGASNTHLERRHCHSVPGSYAGDSAYSLEAYAQDLGKLLLSLNVTNAWLIGHSLGGSIALWAAKLFPDLVDGVICVNAGGGVYLPGEFKRFRQAGQQIVRWRPAWLASVPLMPYLFTRLMVFKPLTQQWGTQRLADLLAAHEAAALGALLESTTEIAVHRLPQVVANLQQPAYFIAGANDTIMEEQYVRHLASFHRAFQDSDNNVAVLPECGHMAMLEQPIALVQMIRSMLSAAPMLGDRLPQTTLDTGKS